MKLFSFFLLLTTVVSISASAGSTQIHQHKSRDVGSHPLPRLAIQVERDPMDGINVHLVLQDYVINSPATATPEGDDDAVLQGHAHVYVNGVKRQRLYGEDVHIPANWLIDGVNQIAVSLNSHQHENWMSDAHTIVASAFINLKNEPLVMHYYASQPPDNMLAAND